MALPFKLHVGHTVILTDDYGRESKFYVREIKTAGWMLEPYEQEGERRYYSGEIIQRHYLAARFKYLPWDDDAIPAARRRRLDGEFTAQPYEARVAAERRLAIVRACEKATAAGKGKCATLSSVPGVIVSEKSDEWLKEDTEQAKKLHDAREAKGLLNPGEYFVEPKRVKAPVARTAWDWMRRYTESGRSINSLLDNHGDKGRRESQLSAEQDQELETFFQDHVKMRGGFEPAAAYKKLSKILKGKKIPSISRRTFKRRLEREYNKKGISQLVFGIRASRRVGETSSRGIIPLFPLHQVESDHTLINIRVVDDETGIDFGRPWISVVKDRLTMAVTGLHVSFLAPSWATLSRALVHSMWHKDLSAFSSIKHDWPAEGISDEIYTDRGMDFISNAGRWVAAEMKFEILNLPGYMPWLKGSLERWNRDLKSEILTYRDGVTSFKDPEYRSTKLPTVKISELKSGLLEWVVDDYLSEGHSSLNDVSPNEVWREEIDRHGPPRPVEDFDKFRRMTMIPKRRTIQNRGVEFGGFFFNDLHGELSELRKRHDAPKHYLVLIDPWDSGYIEINIGTRWLVLLNEFPKLNGISHYRSEFYWKNASLAHPGKRLTVDDFGRSRESVDADAGRVLALGPLMNRRGSQNLLGRFLDLGQFITPVPLRQVRFEQPPISIPGFVERSGILRPMGMPQPTPASIGQLTAPPITAQQVPPFPVIAQTGFTEGRQGQLNLANSAEPEDMFARIAASAKARARELGS